MPSNVPMYTRPLATDRLVKWLKRRDLVAARPELRAGARVERVQRRVGRVRDAIDRRVVRQADVDRRLRRILAAAVANTTPLAITTGSAFTMLRDSHAGTSSHVRGALLDLEGRHRALRHLAVLDGRRERRSAWAPRRASAPTACRRCLPRWPARPTDPAPAKCTSSLQTSGVWCTGVRWSSPPSALVSSSQMRHSLLDCAVYSRPLYSKIGPVTFMSRSRLRSQKAFLRREPVLHLHGLGCRVLLGRDDRLAEDLLLRKVVAVAAAGIHATVLADGRAQSRPQPAAARIEAAHLLRRQVVRVELVRVAAAPLRGRRVEDVVEVVQPVRLPVGRQERLGGRASPRPWRHQAFAAGRPTRSHTPCTSRASSRAR